MMYSQALKKATTYFFRMIPKGYRRWIEIPFSDVVLEIYSDSYLLNAFEINFEIEKDRLKRKLDLRTDKYQKIAYVIAVKENLLELFEHELVEIILRFSDENIVDLMNENIRMNEVFEGIPAIDLPWFKDYTNLKKDTLKAGINALKGKPQDKGNLHQLVSSWEDLEEEYLQGLNIPFDDIKYESSNSFYDFSLMKFGRIFLFVHYLKKYLDFLELNLVFLNREGTSVIFESLPSGFEKIYLEMSEIEIEHFFSFLYKEVDKNGKPFLSKMETNELLKYGFAVPPQPKKKYFELFFSGWKNSRAAFLHAIFTLMSKIEKNKTMTDEKTKAARFLKYYFSEYKDKSIEKIKKEIKGYEAKGKFDVYKYFDKKE